MMAMPISHVQFGTQYPHVQQRFGQRKHPVQHTPQFGSTRWLLPAASMVLALTTIGCGDSSKTAPVAPVTDSIQVSSHGNVHGVIAKDDTGNMTLQVLDPLTHKPTSLQYPLELPALPASQQQSQADLIMKFNNLNNGDKIIVHDGDLKTVNGVTKSYTVNSFSKVREAVVHSTDYGLTVIREDNKNMGKHQHFDGKSVFDVVVLPRQVSDSVAEVYGSLQRKHKVDVTGRYNSYGHFIVESLVVLNGDKIPKIERKPIPDVRPKAFDNQTFLVHAAFTNGNGDFMMIGENPSTGFRFPIQLSQADSDQVRDTGKAAWRFDIGKLTGRFTQPGRGAPWHLVPEELTITDPVRALHGDKELSITGSLIVIPPSPFMRTNVDVFLVKESSGRRFFVTFDNDSKEAAQTKLSTWAKDAKANNQPPPIVTIKGKGTVGGGPVQAALVVETTSDAIERVR